MSKYNLIIKTTSINGIKKLYCHKRVIPSITPNGYYRGPTWILEETHGYYRRPTCVLHKPHVGGRRHHRFQNHCGSRYTEGRFKLLPWTAECVSLRDTNTYEPTHAHKHTHTYIPTNTRMSCQPHSHIITTPPRPILREVSIVIALR